MPIYNMATEASIWLRRHGTWALNWVLTWAEKLFNSCFQVSWQSLQHQPLPVWISLATRAMCPSWLHDARICDGSGPLIVPATGAHPKSVHSLNASCLTPVVHYSQNFSKSKSVLPKMLARSGLVGKRNSRPHLGQFQAFFPWAGKQKMNFAYFPG